MIIHKFKKTYLGIVLNRPSKINKSPYLADVDYNGKSYMAHTPSLSLSGLIKKDAIVVMEKNENKNNVSKLCESLINEI